MGLVEQVFGICRTCSRLELYDVNYGGNERMTKRLTIALVALAIFVLVVMVPVSATKVSTGPNYYYNVAQNISVWFNGVYWRITSEPQPAGID